MTNKKKTVIYFFSVFFFMVAFTFAAVPLYDWFCRTTGFGGTPIKRDYTVDSTDIPFQVRFDSNIEKGLDLTFVPTQRTQNLNIGQDGLAFYRVTNNSNRDIITTSSFNVAPLELGGYFIKVECFCFVEQTVKAGETIEMPVSYYIDPEILKDLDYSNARNITLSYTMYEVDPSGD